MHRTIRFAPPAPKALVFFLHGSGGGSIITQRVDITEPINALVDQGFAFTALDSLDRVDNRWDIAVQDATNPDFTRLMAERDDFIASGRITSSTPIYFWGFSNGGQASYLFSQLAIDSGVPLKAIAAHASPTPGDGSWDPISVISVPTFFSVLENDISVSVASSTITSRPDEIQTQFDGVVAKGLDAQFHVGLEKAINPQRFTRIPGVTPDLAQELFDLIVADGMINAGGLRLVDKPTLDDYTPNLASLTSTPDPGFSFAFFEAEVGRQINVFSAGHVYSSEFVDQHVAFFVSHLPEPSTALLLAAGNLTLLTMRKR